MPFARLRHGIVSLTAILIKDPFLKFHADKWRGLAVFNEAARSSYMLSKVFAPTIPTMNEYSSIAEHFKRKPKLLFRGYANIPSDHEPFDKSKTDWMSDQHFADQRLAGTNPMNLNKITLSGEVGVNWNELKSTLNEKFEWESVVSKALNGMPFDTAIEEGHLYVLHHPYADDLMTMADEVDKDPKRRMWKFMSPIALFASVPSKDSSSEARLLPVAIQMDHEQSSPVYTPNDGDLWTLAKLNVQLTDLEVSQIVEHLSKVHFIAEGLCVSVERQLSYQHPLYVIMRYHCRGVLVANTYGGPVLLADNLKLDSLFPYGYEGANELVAKTAKMFEWGDIKLENNIKRRGVDDTRRLPYYPFRDDGAEIEKAIRLMMTDYVDAYYPRDRDVKRDNEVQDFASEVSDEGRISKVMLRGFPATIDTKEQLVDTFTQIIWLMTGQHASVNYPMLDYITYVPNTPLKLYDSDRIPNTTFGPERLPNRAQAASQASFGVSLATYREDSLFDYGKTLKDGKGRKVVSRYYNYLKDVVDPLLEMRNHKRLVEGHLTYPYMQPRWVPNGIQT
ncbi:arachidonate 5-lipoxygenase-like [Actinia tenebrosa]|uniref:Arachidonate 5-lipoxygenase-like n=1 Tax=Actinia tenebrosa TaxID=6105 RepID=A0A6P8IX59_ACTTE|nr:arachidonate 5-lipoxygenase-like [Actinia tenebrosa]